MSSTTPVTPQCHFQRIAAEPVQTQANRVFQNWPGNITFTAPLTFKPRTLAQLANAILQSESAGHHVRAQGSKWSFSDAVYAGSETLPGAMIVTDQLKNSLQGSLLFILASGVDPTFLFHVEAGIKSDDLLKMLSKQGQALEAGGASRQSLAGLISTSTHSAESLVPPFVDYVQAIHLVGEGGIEHWIERDVGITDPTRLQSSYPCLAAGNIHYSTRLFNAALVSAGSMGVIYSVILKTVAEYGLHQHRVATTWEDLLQTDPNLDKVRDGSYLKSRNSVPLQTDIFGVPIMMSEPFQQNGFSQIVINPYPFYGDDASLTQQEGLRVGHHLCFVTNRVTINVPTNPHNPLTAISPDTLGVGMGQAAVAALASPGSPVYAVEGLKFQNFANGLTLENKTLSEKAAALVDFLADHYNPGTISALIHYVLRNILPIADRWDSSDKLREVISWDDEIKSFCVEAAFPVAAALAFVPQVLDLVASYAARTPRVYIGGYLALRFVGQKTEALLGMQRWSPTCCVEYLGVAGSRGIGEFADDLQRLALAAGGVLHLGLQNNVMTAADLRNAYGPENIAAFRRARSILSNNGTQGTFDNSFTERLELSALKKADISFLMPLLLSGPL